MPTFHYVAAENAATTRIARIAALNDAFHQSLIGGRVLITVGVMGLQIVINGKLNAAAQLSSAL